MSFNFEFSWVENGGVKDSLLRATWGEWRFRANDRWISEILDTRSQSVRHGAYGSALPFAEWLVDNWWFVFSESSGLLESLSSGRELSRFPKWRSWIKRHNLLSVGEGMAAPDCYLFRDGGRIRIAWFSEPDRRDERAAARFVSGGDEFVGTDDVRQELARFVESTLQRLRDRGLEPPEDLLGDWEEIKTSSSGDEHLARLAAANGIHPYCEMGDGDEANLEKLLLVPEEVAFELLSISNIQQAVGLSRQVSTAVEIASKLSGGLPDFGIKGKLPPLFDFQAPAFRVGYQRAARLRELLGLDSDSPIDDLEGLFEKAFAWPIGNQSIEVPFEGKLISGLAMLDRNGCPKLAGPPLHRSASRFRLVRGAGAFLDGVAERESIQMLTNSSEWRQKAGRAFAAEFLAPKDGIQRRLGSGTVDKSDIDDLAKVFDVDFLVVRHQIENHDLATVVIS